MPLLLPLFSLIISPFRRHFFAAAIDYYFAAAFAAI